MFIKLNKLQKLEINEDWIVILLTKVEFIFWNFVMISQK